MTLKLIGEFQREIYGICGVSWSWFQIMRVAPFLGIYKLFCGTSNMLLQALDGF